MKGSFDSQRVATHRLRTVGLEQLTGSMLKETLLQLSWLRASLVTVPVRTCPGTVGLVLCGAEEGMSLMEGESMLLVR